jgi:phage pi2 protein 07
MFTSKNNNIIDFTDNIIICLSELNQEDIISLTYKYFREHNRIPYSTELDENVIILDYPVYVFNQIYNMMNENDKKKFNIKIFFTNVIDKNMLKVKKMGDPYYPNEKIDQKYHQNKKKIDKFLENIYYTYYSSINNNKYI